jgi:hypothetical protein
LGLPNRAALEHNPTTPRPSRKAARGNSFCFAMKRQFRRFDGAKAKG